MVFTVTVCAVTALLVMLSVLIKPDVKIGKYKFGTYWIISVIGALILLLSGALPLRFLATGLTADTSVNPIKILVLFFSMTSLSVFLDVLGFFRYLANVVLSKAGADQKKLFLLLYVTVSVLTVFTSNDIIILTFTPFICFFAKKAKIDPLPYLIAEFVAANTWSMALIIGNPTNIYLASASGIDFISYLKVMILPTIAGGTVSFIVLYFLFKKTLSQPIKTDVVNEPLNRKKMIGWGLIHLGLCTLLLAIGSYIGIEMWLVSLGFALSLFISVTAIYLIKGKKPNILYRTFVRLPFELVPFVLSMFTIVLALDYSGATEKLSSLFSGNYVSYIFGAASILSANVINNIPMSVLFSSILDNVSLTQAQYLESVYSCIAGSNIGAYLTPVGALAGIMWSSILKLYKINIAFKDFIKYGVTIAIPTLLAILLIINILI